MNELPAFMNNKLNSNSSWLISLFFLVISLQFVSCSNSVRQNKEDAVNDEYIDTIPSKPAATFTDTIIIDFPAAVFYNPDSLQLQKIKAITDTMVFQSIIHDCLYQMRNSRNILRQNWPKIKIVEISNVRYIVFKPVNGMNECIDLNTKNDPCGIFIFDGHKKARLVDMTNIESELGLYFSG